MTLSVHSNAGKSQPAHFLSERVLLPLISSWGRSEYAARSLGHHMDSSCPWVVPGPAAKAALTMNKSLSGSFTADLGLFIIYDSVNHISHG